MPLRLDLPCSPPPGSDPPHARPRSGAPVALLAVALLVAALATLTGRGSSTPRGTDHEKFGYLAPNANDGLKLLLSDVHLSPAQISPPHACEGASGDGVQDQTQIQYRVIWPESVNVGVFIDSADGSPRGWIEYPRKRAPSRSYVVNFGGCLFGEFSSSPLADGYYLLKVWAQNDTNRVEEDTLAIEIDRTRPKVLSIAEANGITSFRNGETVVIDARLDRPGYRVTPDFGWLDSDPEATTTVYDQGDGRYQIRHYISADNRMVDARNIMVPILFQDLAGNTQTDTSFRTCLSNHPPQFISAWFPDGTNLFKNGSSIKIMMVWAIGTPISDLHADFGAIDSKYDSSKVTRKEWFHQAEAIDTIEVTYSSISTDNIRTDGTDFRLVIRVLDQGCGSATDRSLVMGLDNHKPAAPVLNAVTTPTRNATITVTGRAVGLNGLRDALSVDFKRSTTVLHTASVEVDGRFEGTLSLNPGENSFTAEAVDTAGNKSVTTSFQVYRLSEAFVTIPARFTPGSTFKLGLARAGRSLRVELWSLAGDLIAVLEDQVPRDIYTLSWNGKNEAGQEVNSGPILSLIEINYADGTRETMKRAILLVKATP